MDRQEFLGNGFVELLETNPHDRNVSIKLCMPCNLFQTVTPQLLSHGLIDEFAVRNPIITWMPQLTIERFCVNGLDKETINTVNICLKDEIMRISNLFIHMSNYLHDPSDLVPMLPMGVYIECTYRCSVDKIIKILEGIDSIKVIGVSEFQWAMASVLGYVLDIFSRIDKDRISQKLLR